MRRVRRKVASKDKVFGCDLLEHLSATGQDVPQVLRCCCQFVEEHGVVDGIYRLSGVSSNIQKLRAEFESEGTPDLGKEVYLQDIHCVSSLCKAYFRELPNPLLTYQLYDKFAEAVAVQLEEERLVKIQDVLKKLPMPHYRTLEFLMCHLVKMASYSSETNMHARNLAIVWAPNLLRSKDIEVSGFNGTAVFMEVRVQSIVVEFILTHVPQLFPEPSLTDSRRKSLPSPTAISSQEEPLFTVPSPANFGHISPGDGPIPIRPYHAIIEGTDKRKGSFKGRKWMSIFNIGSRFHDPRRRHKHSAKEKDRPALRPARSMDSLSIQSYSNEDPVRPLQTSRSAKMSGLEFPASSSPLGGSEYAVTYRRGTGLVSGGTQGTYTALDPEGTGGADADSAQSKSPGLSTKAGRRAAMHITGPTMVTVPLHITSNLALGVLQGGGSDRVVHRGRDKLGGNETGDNVQSTDSGRMEMKVEEVKEVKEKAKEVTHRKEINLGEDTNTLVDREEEKKNEKAFGEDCQSEPAAKETPAKILNCNVDEDAYEEMQRVSSAKCEDDNVFDFSGVLNSTKLEQDDQELSGYVEDNFEFLDHMDCSASCQIPFHFLPDSASQVKEFSVEPPGHSDDEYEVMEQPCHRTTGADGSLSVGSETNLPSQSKTLQRPRSVDSNDRHAKSLSLPHMTSPVCDPEDCCSGDDYDTADDDTVDYSSSDEDSSLFAKSLPADFLLYNAHDLQLEDLAAADSALVDQSCESIDFNTESSTAKQQNDDQSRDDVDRAEETILENEDHQKENYLRNEDLKIKEADLEPLPIEVPSHHCVDLQEHTDESSVKANDSVQVDKVRQGAGEISQFSIVELAEKDTSPVEEILDVSEKTTEEFHEDHDGSESTETEDVNPETSVVADIPTKDGKVRSLGKTHEDVLVIDNTFVWDEPVEVVCEAIGDDERQTGEVRESSETNEMETTAEKNPEDTDIILPERRNQEEAILGSLLSKDDKTILEEVKGLPSLGHDPLKKLRSAVPDFNERVNFKAREPEAYKGEVIELLVPKEDKQIVEEVTVTSSFTDTPQEGITPDVLEFEERGRLKEQGPERREQEGTIMLVPKKDNPICDEVILTPSLPDAPMKAVRTDSPESRDWLRFEEQETEHCEHKGAVTETLVPRGIKPICKEVTITAAPRDTPLKEVISDVSNSTDDLRFEEQGPERSELQGVVSESCEHERAVTERLLPREVKPICEEVTMTATLRDTPLKEVRSERSELHGIVAERLVTKEDKAMCEEVTVTPGLRDMATEEIRSDSPEFREDVRFEEQEPESHEHKRATTEKLVPEEDKSMCEDVTVIPGLRDMPREESRSDSTEFREDVRFEEQEPESREHERATTEQLVPKEDKSMCEDVTVIPGLRDMPREESKSDSTEFREDVRFEAQEPESREHETATTEMLVPEEDKSMCEDVAVIPGLRDMPREESRSDSTESRDGVRFGQQGPESHEHHGAVMQKLIPEEDRVKVTPSLRAEPLKEARSDSPESREGLSLAEQVPEWSEHQGIVTKKFVAKDNTPICEEVPLTPTLRDSFPKEFWSDVPDSREGVRFDERGVGRKLVISKLPKVYQAKAVPVVPPKPQHCKLAARSLRQQQQQQQRDRRDADAPDEVSAACGKDASRNSPLSMCFDEAVAIATMRREKERECERDRQRDWVGEVK